MVISPPSSASSPFSNRGLIFPFLVKFPSSEISFSSGVHFQLKHVKLQRTSPWIEVDSMKIAIGR